MTQFKVKEVCLLVDILNGTYIDDWQGDEARQYFVAEVEDACLMSNAHVTWAVDEAALVRKLQAMTPEEATELPRLVRGFRATGNEQHPDDLREAILASFPGWIDD